MIPLGIIGRGFWIPPRVNPLSGGLRGPLLLGARFASPCRLGSGEWARRCVRNLDGASVTVKGALPGSTCYTLSYVVELEEVIPKWYNTWGRL